VETSQALMQAVDTKFTGCFVPHPEGSCTRVFRLVLRSEATSQSGKRPSSARRSVLREGRSYYAE
jgi:hypothetical protein